MGAEFSKILIVDDFELMRAMLKNALADLGITDVEEAEDGKSAWTLIVAAFDKKRPFHAIFCDWNMPVMTGIELLEKLRSDERFAELPFIMVTAESEKDFVIHALKEGATDYIVKPIAAPTVKRKIEMLQRRIQNKK